MFRVLTDGICDHVLTWAFLDDKWWFISFYIHMPI